MENLALLKEAWQEVEAPQQMNMSNVKAKSLAAVRKTNRSLKRTILSLVAALVIMIAVWVFIPFPSVVPKVFLALVMGLMIAFAFIYDYHRKKNEQVDPVLSPADYLEEVRGFVRRKNLMRALTLSIYLPLLFVFVLNYLLTLFFIEIPPLALGIILSGLLIGVMIIIAVSLIRYKKTSNRVDTLIEELETANG